MLIATRILKIRRPEGDIDVPVRLFAPEHEPRRGWGCLFQIDWPEGRQEMKSGGFDAMQAVEIALRLIGVHLYTSSYHEAGELMFDKPGNGYGFPLTPDLRDLLVGDDAKYF